MGRGGLWLAQMSLYLFGTGSIPDRPTRNYLHY
jgi:hypothetical protein